jgi:hypothetical protein
MSLTLGRYELILRPVTGGDKEFVIGEFTFEARQGPDDTVDFYDVNRELDGVFSRVQVVPPETEQ